MAAPRVITIRYSDGEEENFYGYGDGKRTFLRWIDDRREQIIDNGGVVNHERFLDTKTKKKFSIHCTQCLKLGCEASHLTLPAGCKEHGDEFLSSENMVTFHKHYRASEDYVDKHESGCKCISKSSKSNRNKQSKPRIVSITDFEISASDEFKKIELKKTINDDGLISILSDFKTEIKDIIESNEDIDECRIDKQIDLTLKSIPRKVGGSNIEIDLQEMTNKYYIGKIIIRLPSVYEFMFWEEYTRRDKTSVFKSIKPEQINHEKKEIIIPFEKIMNPVYWSGYEENSIDFGSMQSDDIIEHEIDSPLVKVAGIDVAWFTRIQKIGLKNGYFFTPYYKQTSAIIEQISEKGDFLLIINSSSHKEVKLNLEYLPDFQGHTEDEMDVIEEYLDEEDFVFDHQIESFEYENLHKNIKIPGKGLFFYKVRLGGKGKLVIKQKRVPMGNEFISPILLKFIFSNKDPLKLEIKRDIPTPQVQAKIVRFLLQEKFDEFKDPNWIIPPIDDELVT